MCDGSAPRWAYWNKKDTKEQWRWLKDLCFYIRRRQVRECTEQLWGPKTEEIEDEIPGSIDGVEERHLNVVDTTKEPRLAITEWGKLKTCERPFSKDEWGEWQTITNWESRIRIPRGKGGEGGRSERRGADSGIEYRDTKKSRTATECESAAQAAFDARHRSAKRKRRREGGNGARQGQGPG